MIYGEYPNTLYHRFILPFVSAVTRASCKFGGALADQRHGLLYVAVAGCLVFLGGSSRMNAHDTSAVWPLS